MRRPGSVVHSENSYASGNKKRPRGPRSTFAVEAMRSSKPALQRGLVDLKTEATGYYVHYYLQSLPNILDISKSVLDDFMPIWLSKAENRMLDLALSSMALAVFSQARQHTRAALDASTNYQQLLRTTRGTICSLYEGNIDAWLLAIFFMSRQRHSTAISAVNLQTFCHHDGALAILKTWKESLSHYHPPTSIIKHTRRGMIRSALLRKLALPDWILDGAAFGEEGWELEYDYLSVRITNLRYQVSLLVKEAATQDPSPGFTSAARALNNEACEIDNGLKVWNSRFPHAWSTQRHILSDPPPLPTTFFYSSTVLTCSSVAYTAVWNQYYAMRMLHNSTHLKILSLCHPNPDAFDETQRLECVSCVETMANDLASSIPFCLQKFEVVGNTDSSEDQSLVTMFTNHDLKPPMASMTVWPLSIASCLGDVKVEQRLWFSDILSRLGRMLGDRVIESEGDQWFEL
ncbi:hypothetical protein LSUB1_G004622 [Lachnellula subtilissima]|uniref:Transcription factor domain-containing protein n=1 Tax=Lachnellula subtilissima TaxID=602034 RepID=A0A8H8RKY6_9HELO|nr:hypothetical protein LSUB1_G004622 [Lachnellula subtilissima]